MNITENKELINYLLHCVIVDKKATLLNVPINSKFIFTKESSSCAFFDEENNAKAINQYTHRLLLRSLLDNEKSSFLFKNDDEEYKLLERISFNSFNQFLTAIEGDFEIVFEINNAYYHYSNRNEISSVIGCKILQQINYAMKQVDLCYHITDFEKLCIENYISVFKVVEY